jgi:hypothetical protein
VKNRGEISVLKKLNSLCTFGEMGFIKFLEGEIHLTKFREAIGARAKSHTQHLIRGDAIQRYCFGKSSKDSFINTKIIRTLSNSPKLQDVGQKRLVYQQIVNMQKKQRLNFQLLSENVYVANTCGYVLNQSSAYHIAFVLGLLNSTLLNWRYKLTSSNNHVLTNDLYQLPFPPLDLSKQKDKQSHDTVVRYVHQLLQLYRDLRDATLPNRKEQLQSRIGYVEDRIDAIVYELYGLTKEEIAIIEGEE